MTKVAPFQAFVYNQDKISDLSKVVCPPYDIISPARQQYYHNLDTHNLIHVLLGKDIRGEDKYMRAGTIFDSWVRDKILVRDPAPGIYFYSQQYPLKGEKRTRFGFIALLRLGDKSSPVFAHEHTRLEPKEDRARLLRAVRANLSPIFVLFPDKKRLIPSLYEHCSGRQEKPFIELVDDEKITHKLWRITSSPILEKVRSRMTDENIFIADGHHRYEVACMYRDEMRLKMPRACADEPFDYILSYFTNTDVKGLSILPIHRLVQVGKDFSADAFINKVSGHFDVEEVKDRVRFFFLLEKSGLAEHVLGMYKDKRFWLLRLKNVTIVDKIITDKPREYRSLDVSILNYLVLNDALGLGSQDDSAVRFNPDPGELIDTVDAGDSCVAFFLNPVKVQQIMAVALTGERMPPKSTYFYPKVLSGLVINKHS